MSTAARVVEGHIARAVPLVWRNPGPPAASAPPVPDPEPLSTADAAREAHIAALEQKARQAYQEGLRDGEAAGREAAREGIEHMAEKLAATIAGVAATRGDVIRRAEADIIRLSIEVARRILHRELTVDTSALEALIRAALEKLKSQEIYRVRVHPDQEQLVRACMQQIGRRSEIEIVGDPSQPRGGAVFETPRGSLDASVETQLREIERGFADELGERS